MVIRMMGWRERRAARAADMARKGEILRRLHWQCWRDVPAGDALAVDVSLEELVQVLPVPIESGSVGLVWPRLAHREAELGAVGSALRAAYEAQAAHNARVEGEIARVVGLLRERDVDPVLIKGYAVARLYPAPLVRPAGDIDLVVRDADYAAAKAALAGWGGGVSFHGDPAARREHAATTTASTGRQREGDHRHEGDDGGGGDHPYRPYAPAGEVDLHRYSTWYGAGVDEARFFGKGPLPLLASDSAGSTRAEILVPRVEDHVRALCLHFLRHGAVRPMRLCDIAVLIESDEGDNEGPLRFSRKALGRDRPSDWERVLAGTAREREQVAVTLRLAEALLGARLPPALASRWPDPISATYRVGWRFDEDARWPIQTAAFGKHAWLYGASLLPRTTIGREKP
jgi:hypothetical protein